MANRILISIQDILSIEVESEELTFRDLKEEAEDLFKFAKKNLVKCTVASLDEVA